MLTIFATAKPFFGHTAIIQRNALQSWKALHPEIEIILFGADEGAAEAAGEFGLRHEPHVERNERGTKRLDYLFARAQAIARHDLLCYVNCDIILMQDFHRAIERVGAVHREFLMVGRRWDTDITTPLAFDHADWQPELRTLASRNGRKRSAEWIDYFAFTRGLYGPGMPPFVLRVFWDNWLVWNALDAGKPVIDASRAVMAVHQNHDYSYHPQGKAGVWSGEEAGLNGRLAGGWRHLRTIADATEVLPPEKLRHTISGGTEVLPPEKLRPATIGGTEALPPERLKRNTLRHWSTAKRYARQAGRVLWYDVWHPVWFSLLNFTRPLRRSLRH